MTSKTFYSGMLAVAVATVALQGLVQNRAEAAFPFSLHCPSQTGCSICCPACDHCCKLDAEQIEEKIPCFDVESKLVCIPRVVFPWQRKKCSACDSCDGRGCTNCVHNGARVRRVCVLKTDSIKCPKCEYTWSPEEQGQGCDSACPSKSCDESIPVTWLEAMGTH
jgi:hypothetical protein